jgi:hypothetical protein
VLDTGIFVSGNRVIFENLDKFNAELQVRVQAKLEEGATYGLARAEERVRVRTGFLRSRLYVEVRDGQIILGDDASYAPFVELGTSKMKAQPYLVPSALEMGAWLMEQLKGIM